MSGKNDFVCHHLPNSLDRLNLIIILLILLPSFAYSIYHSLSLDNCLTFTLSLFVHTNVSAARFTTLGISDYPLPPKDVYPKQPLCFGNESSLADCGLATITGTALRGTVIVQCAGTLQCMR